MSRARWKILSSAVVERKCRIRQDAFPNYDTVQFRRRNDQREDDEAEWETVIFTDFPTIQYEVRFVPSRISIEDLTGFNNTGNVRIWPSEQCLAQYVLENPDLFSGKSVIELGSGMTGLAGLASIAVGSSYVVLTDGNETSVSNLREIASHNGFSSSRTDVRVLNWKTGTATDRFDVILCSDCVFFDDGRVELARFIVDSLNDDGIALIAAPSRGGTLTEFYRCLIEFSDRVSVELKQNYSRKIHELKIAFRNDDRFNEDVHYPLLIHCHKNI